MEAVLEVGKAVNTYLEEQAPWTALKKGDEQQKAAAAQVGGWVDGDYVAIYAADVPRLWSGRQLQPPQQA